MLFRVLAPTLNVFALSDRIDSGIPRLLINRLKPPRNALVVMSSAISR